MNVSDMTQAEYDEKVNTIAAHHVRMVYSAAQLRKQFEPTAYVREEECVMLANVLYSLSFYDVDSTIFTDDEIRDLFGLATSIIQYCPL